jgi:hypothetical protein
MPLFDDFVIPENDHLAEQMGVDIYDPAAVERAEKEGIVKS